MEPLDVLPGDENAAVPAHKKPELLGDVVRSPLQDVSNFADVTLNGNSNLGDKTIVEVDDSSPCGSKSETESPASSTPSRLDTTTDDYESADEGSPIREVNLSVLASQLETLSLGTPKPTSVRPGVLFPYSPVSEDSILLSSPDKDEREHLGSAVDVSPITLVGGSPRGNWSPESVVGLSSGTNQFSEPVFKVPEAIGKRERPSIASSCATGRGDDSFYTADSTFWSPSHNLNATIAKSLEENFDESSVKSPGTVEEHDSTTASVSCESQPASSEVECKPNNYFKEPLLNRNPKADDCSGQTEDAKSPVSDFIANADKITLRDDSPLATSIKEKCYGEDLDSSLAPARFEIEQVIPKRHSTGLCKKEVFSEPVDEEFRRHSFHENPSNNGFSVLESPENPSRRKSTKFFLRFEKVDGSRNSLDKSSDFSAELEIAKDVVDSCIAAATNEVNSSPQQDDVKVVDSKEIKENLDTVGTIVSEVEENLEVETTSFSNSERLLEEIGVAHPNAESIIHVDDSLDSNLPEKDLFAEDNESARDSEILTEDIPMPRPSTVGLSINTVSNGLSVNDSKSDVSVNSDDSVSISESTIIENENIVSSRGPKQELVAHASDIVKEDTSIPNVTDLPSGKTEVSSGASIQLESDNLRSPVQSEDSGLRTVDQVVSSLSNTTSEGEKIIEAGEQTSEIAESVESASLKVTIESKFTSPHEETQAPEEVTKPTSQLPVILSKTDCDVNTVTSSEPIHDLSVSNAVDNDKIDSGQSVPIETEIPSEKTEVTYPSELQSCPTEIIQDDPSPESSPSPIENEINVNNTSGEDKIVHFESAILPNPNGEYTVPSVSLPCKTIATEETKIAQKFGVSIESAGTPCMPEIHSKPDSTLNVVTSVEPNLELVEDHATRSAKEDTRATIPDLTETPLEETDETCIPQLQSNITVLAEQPLENLPSTIESEACTNDTSKEENIAECKIHSQTSEIIDPAESFPLKPDAIENLASPPNETLIIQRAEDVAGSTSLLPNADVKAVSSSETIGLATDRAKDGISVIIPNETTIPTENTELTSAVQTSLTAPVEAEKPSESLSSPVDIEAHSNNTASEDTVMPAAAAPNQTSDIAESAVGSSGLNEIAIENKLSSSPDKPLVVQKSGDSTELPSQLPGVTSKPDANVNVPSSVQVDFSTGMSTSGESFIVSKENKGSQRTETNLDGINELITKVDFSNLAGLKENPRQEQDIKSESLNFYSSPESTTVQNTSGDKVPLDRSYKDLSTIFATCSKQEQELGGRTFDFSCIQAEAAKIASDISAADEAKASGLSNKQPMMQSSLSAETNNSEAGPVTADEDFHKEEFFQDVTALDFDYLARAGSKHHCPSKLSRQSLYVKFDPLVGKLLASSEDSNSSLVVAMADSNQSSGEEGKLDITPPSRSESDDRLIPITPATVKKDNRQSAGGHTPSLRQEISKLQELMIQQEQAHQEKADLVEELRSRIAELEASDNRKDTSDLEKQLKQRDEELKQKEDELEKARASNKQLVQVMEEYEKTISQLVTVKEETKAQMEKDKETIGAERDTALQHLTNMEIAFNDIHQKYERTKTVVETLHANEKELKKSYDAAVERVEAQNIAYQKLKQHAAEKLTAANAEIERIHKEYNGEMARMKAVAKKNELKCKSLEESLEQKKNELRELTQICDELIANHTPS